MTELEVVIAWLPNGAASSLRTGTRALAPALLYADKVRVLSWNADDTAELVDTRELDSALGAVIQFDALTSSYWKDDATPQQRQAMDPEALVSLDAEPRRLVAQWYADRVRKSLEEGNADEDTREAAIRTLILDERVFDEMVWDLESHDALPKRWGSEDALMLKFAWLEETYGIEPQHHDDLAAEVLLAAHVLRTSAATIGLVDDLRGNLEASGLAQGTDAIRSWNRERHAEASLAVGVIQRLPSIGAVPWDVVLDVRESLSEPLTRFRSAMATISAGAEHHPLEDDYEGFVEHTWRTVAQPALLELETRTRENSFREVFFNDALSDLTTYAGPAIGVAAASGAGVSELAGAVLGLAPQLGRALASVRRGQRELHQHQYFYLSELSRRITGP